MLYTISPDGVIPAGPDAASGRPGAGRRRSRPGRRPGDRGAGSGCGLPGRRGGTGAPVASAMPVTSGEMLVFTCPVTVAPAIVNGRDGAVRARGWLPDHVRLGELERHLGEGVIEDLVAAGIAAGRMPAPQRQRQMSLVQLRRFSFGDSSAHTRSARGTEARLPSRRPICSSMLPICWPSVVPRRLADRWASWPQTETLGGHCAQVTMLSRTFPQVKLGGQGQDRTADLPLFRPDNRPGPGGTIRRGRCSQAGGGWRRLLSLSSGLSSHRPRASA